MNLYIRRGKPSENFPSHQNFHFSAKNLLDERMQEQDLFWSLRSSIQHIMICFFDEKVLNLIFLVICDNLKCTMTSINPAT